MIKLHIGCGWNILPGWVNCDLRPRRKDVLQMDVTRGIPFPDGIVDYVFHEHMIEHLPRAEGRAFLEECLRVLRPGGTIRVAAPDLDFLWKLLHDPTELTRRYVKETVANLLPDEEVPHPVLVVNNFFNSQSFGHEFIYDFGFLSDTLERVGFVDPRRAEVGKSADPHLDDLEHRGRLPEGFLELESMVVEARKPE